MKYLTENKYWELNKEYNIDKILYLLIDRQDYINGFGSFLWYNELYENHRDYDLPAFVNGKVYYKWSVNNMFHRKENRPAVIFSNGRKEYYSNSKFIKYNEIFNTK